MTLAEISTELTPPNVSMDRINDYVSSGKNLILSQYRNSNVLNIYLESLLKQVQELEDVIYDVYLHMPLEFMYGVQLDRVGLSYGLLRNGLDDISFKTRIITQIQLNLSSGTPESIIRATKLLSGATKVKFTEVFPAGVSLYIENNWFSNDLTQLIQSFLTAGVELKNVSVSFYDNPFTLAEVYYEYKDFYLDVVYNSNDYYLNVEGVNNTALIVNDGEVRVLSSNLSLSEVILNKSYLQVDSDSYLMLDDGSYLEIVPLDANEDYTIVQSGGKLIEIIK